MSNWREYYEYDEHYDVYRYKDKSVVTLPSDLPQPPITSMRWLFSPCCSLRNITALANWDVSNVTDMSCMFTNCHKLRDITILSNWDTSKVTNAINMFYDCYMSMDLTPLLGRSVNHNIAITGSPTIMFRWEINTLKSHIARLEEQIMELTKPKKETASWYQPIINLFSAD